MNLPLPFINSIKCVQGLDLVEFEKIHNSTQQITSVRINSEKVINADEVLENFATETLPVNWCKNGFYLQERPSFTNDPLFHAGTYYVQEASSMFLGQIVQQLYKNDTQKIVLDVCAAPGGKTTLLSNFFTDGLVVSNEVIKSRVSILVENTVKWGTGNIVVTNNDAKHFSTLESFFDVVVVDAPCSGSGMFRKDKHAIDEWSIENVALCSQRQQRILCDIIPCLKDEGVLIYSTCSYSKEENEDIVDWLLNNFSVETVQINLEKDWNIVETISDHKKGFGYRFYPNKLRGEGFFITVFRSNKSNFDKKLKQKQITLANRQETSFLNEYISDNSHLTFFKHDLEFRLMNENYLNTLSLLANYLHIKKAGTGIGEIKGKDLIPSHELAVSIVRLSNFANISFNKEEALQFLKKKNVEVNAKFGWTLATYKGYGLGWLKVLQNRINNYYPLEWRILKE